MTTDYGPGYFASLKKGRPDTGGPVTLTTAAGTITFGPASGTSAVPMSFGQKAAWYAAVTFAGPPRVMEFLGGTAGDTGLPYQLGAYFTYRGAFYSGTEMVLSNKRFDADGAIQAVSALADGSELSMLAVSPDVDGPSIAVESFGARAAGHVNGAILAGYDLDDVSGGATGYSTGYGKKKFNLTSRGTMEWGANLGVTPGASCDVAVERVQSATALLKQTKGSLWIGGTGQLGVGADPTLDVYKLNVGGAAKCTDLYAANFFSTGNYIALSTALSLGSNSWIFFSNDATWYGTKDVALARSAAGTLEINDGAGTGLRDLKARTVLNSGGLGLWGHASPGAQPAANPDTAGATLAALETEVNELKALLRSYGLMA